MRCCRIIALLLLLVFTACGVCSCFLPLFRASTDNSTSTIQYWYTDKTELSSATNESVIVRLYNNDRVCSVDRMCFTAAAALSTSGAALGGIAALLAAMWVFNANRMCFLYLVTWATFFSFACFATALSLTVFSFVSGTCEKDAATNTSAIKDLTPKHNVVEGFYLSCVVTAGMLGTLVFVVVVYCYPGAYEENWVFESRSPSPDYSMSRSSSVARRASKSRRSSVSHSRHSSRRRRSSSSTLSRRSRSYR